MLVEFNANLLEAKIEFYRFSQKTAHRKNDKPRINCLIKITIFVLNVFQYG
jgi:hypothetical protein